MTTGKVIRNAATPETLEVEVPENGIPASCEVIRPEMLPLVELDQTEIEGIVAGVEGGARNVQDIYALAPLQEGILFHHLMAGEGDPYLLSHLMGFDSRERLEAYVGALQAVIDRHDILRTGVVWERLREPVQVVWRKARLVVEKVEFDAAEGDVAEQLWEWFDPRQYRMDVGQAPLMRAYVAHDEVRGRWLLLLLRHHLISDYTTLEVLQAEIEAHLLGRADVLPVPLLFRNYVAQARLGVSAAEHEVFFGKLLGDVEEPTAPYGLLDVQGDGGGIEEARLKVDGALAGRLRERARKLGVSAASLCHVAWAQVLARVSGREDVVYGTVLFGRMQGGEGSDRVMGLFINTLPVRIGVGEEGVEASVRRTHTLLADLLRHEHASLALAQRCSGVEAPTPLFTALLNYRHSGGGGRARSAEARRGIERLRGEERTNYPLTLSVDDLGEEFGLTVQVRASVGPMRVCALMHRALEVLVGALESAPDRALGSLDVLPESERRQVVEEWNATEVAFPSDMCVHELFETQVKRTPDAEAVLFEDERLSYAELNARANQLAHYLIEGGVGPDARVAICVERSIELVVGLLGILKAGGAYVPLDPEYPVERLRYMLDDSAPVVVLTQGSQAGLFEGLSEKVPVLELDAPQWADRPDTNPDREGVGLTSDNLAYVIYTSGSTGQPKGVMVEHRELVNFIDWYRREFRISERDAVLIATSYSAALTQKNLFSPLFAGGQVHLASEPFDPQGILAHIVECRISMMNLTSSAFHSLIDASRAGEFIGVRLVVLSGEATRPRKLMELAEPRPELVSVYGSTEVLGVAYHRMSPDLETYLDRSVLLGDPISNARIYIVDGRGEPVPVGVVGELYIGGAGVARCYQNRPELTAERFIPDWFSGEAHARLYRTGDLGRWLPDGTIEFVGRNDDQVKVRGYRIELGEIEARLGEHAAVREAVVLAREDAPGDKRLVAYYVGEQAVGAEVLRVHLLERLPEYMVPAAYMRLDVLPLTANGKVDRRALPAPEGDAYVRRGYEAPVGETEDALVELWQEVLGVERVGRWDNFFELGGHSLLVVTLLERMRRRRLHVETRALFTMPTLVGFAAAVGGETLEVEVPENGIPASCEVVRPEMLPLVELDQTEIEGIVAGVEGGARNVQDIYALAPLQEGILFHHLMEGEGDPYLLSHLMGFDSRERLEAYVGALQAVIDRHDILRTGVVWEGLREPVQVVWRKARLVVEEAELDPAEGDVAEQLWEWFDPRQYRMDVGQAPLMRAYVAHDEVQGRWLLLLLRHHLISDHTTLEVLQAEIEAHLLGRADVLPVPLPFRNYVAQAQLGVSAAEHERFFGELLGDVEEPTAPFGLLDVQGNGTGIEEARLEVERALAGRLPASARKLGVSVACVCHVAWAQVLARVSGREDVVFGTVLVGRMQGGEGADRVMGPFINTLPMRIRVGEEGVAMSVRRTHTLLADLLRHEHASLAMAQRCSGVQAPTPLFSALLNFRHHGGEGRKAHSLEVRQAWKGIERLRVEERTNYPLTLSVDDLGESFRLTAKAEGSVGPKRVCLLMHRALEVLVEALEEAPETAVGSLDVLPERERTQVVVEWS